MKRKRRKRKRKRKKKGNEKEKEKEEAEAEKQKKIQKKTSGKVMEKNSDLDNQSQNNGSVIDALGEPARVR